LGRWRYRSVEEVYKDLYTERREGNDVVVVVVGVVVGNDCSTTLNVCDKRAAVYPRDIDGCEGLRGGYDGEDGERDARAITDRLSGSNPLLATHPRPRMRSCIAIAGIFYI